MGIIIKKELNDFEELENLVWSGAVDTLETIKENNKEEELISILSEFEWESDTALNDYLWFDTDNIFEMLDIKNGDK